MSALNSLNNELVEKIRQIKYLNNIVEQDHRFIKKRTKRGRLRIRNLKYAKLAESA